MGNGCGSRQGTSNGFDLNYFSEKYGKQAMIDILRWNVRKEEILKKIPEIQQKYRKIIHNCKIDSIRQLNIVQSSIYDKIQTKIKDIEKNDTGEVTKAQKHYDKCAQDLMGRQQITKNCTQLRNKIHQVYQAEQKNTKETISSNFQAYVQKLQKEKKEKFAEIQQLTEDNRQFIRKQMRKQFKKQIKGYREEVHQQIADGKIADMVHIKQDYNHLHPKEEIQKIKEKAEKLIEEGYKKIIADEGFIVLSKQILPQPGFWGCCGRA